jgi:hypothetical protein
MHWEERNIPMFIKETDSKDVDWIHVAQDRIQRRTLVNTAMKLRQQQ